MTSGIEIVLFDVGGVLVEVAGIERLRQWTNQKRSDEDIWALWLQSRAARAFESGRMCAAEFARELIAELELPVEPEQLLDDFPMWISHVLPGARELLGDVSRGVRRGTLSNSNPLHWTRIMDEMGLGTFFDTHFASHVTGRTKPDLDAFEHALESLDCSPGAIVFIDDNQLNVDAARRVGIHAHRTLGPLDAREVLDRYGLLRRDNTDV